MSVHRFNEKLNALLSKKSIETNDFLSFIKTVSALSKRIQDVKKLPVYGPVVKEWIGAFQKIFGKHKEMRIYMNRLSTIMTKLYLKISQIFHRYERDYTQQFYCHWKQMLSVLVASKRSSSFIKNMNQFKHTVTHLRTAQLRCEQLAILKVLNLYIELVPPSELKKFKKQVIADDMDIVDGLIQLRQQPSSINEFLHRINSMGDSISSFQPTKITCANLALEYTKPEFEMWIDFNLKDKSIMFVAQPSTKDANQCFAIVPDPKLKECVINGEQLIIMKGLWSICTEPEINQSGQKLSVTIFIRNHDRNMIFGSQVRSVFKIKSNTNSSYGETSSIDLHSKEKNSKWRNNQNVLMPPPSYFNNERTTEKPSLRSQLAGSLQSSILLLSSDQSVMEWKKRSCERLSSDGQQNRVLLLQGIAPLRNRNENIKVWDMPNALQQLAIDYDSSESFCDNESVKETYDMFENSIKNGHLTGSKQMLTSTSRRNYDTNVKTSGASYFNERKKSNLKLAENSLNANQLPKTDNTQYIQPSLSVASDNLSIVNQNHFVLSNLVKSHDRNKNGNADSSLILPPPINQTVAINASKPPEIFSNRNVSEMVQNTFIDIATKTVKYEFANDKEFEKASRFYIDNNGSDYLNSTNFKKLNRSQQKTREQQPRAIHDMMNRGLEELHLNLNDDKPHDTDLYDFVSPDRQISERKSNSEKVAGKKLNCPSASSSTNRRRIRNISLLFEDKTAPKLKTSENGHKIMTAPKSEVNRNENKRTKASTTQTFTMNNELADSTAVGKENAISSLPNYRAKKPKIEILSAVDQSSEIMNQCDNQQVFCNVPSSNDLFNNFNKLTLHLIKGLQSIYERLDAINTHLRAQQVSSADV